MNVKTRCGYFSRLSIILVGVVWGLLLVQIAAAAMLNQPSSIVPMGEVGQLLGWVPTQTNLCGGYFSQPQLVLSHPSPLPISQLPSQISASGPTLFSRDGPSILIGDVVYSQPGRMATADKAIIYRNQENRRLELIHLSGHVRLAEYGILVVGPYGDVDLATGTARFGPSAYHFLESPQRLHTFKGTYDAWGQAAGMQRHANGVIDFYHASYTTCAPQAHPPWHLTASHIRLDHDRGMGYAYHSVLHFKSVPVFYIPYYNFPLNNDRKSGLLMPSFDYSTKSDFGVRLPIYWNIAPNYDTLFTPRYIVSRGLQYNSLSRYLTHRSYGEFYASFIPDDAEFADFRTDTLENPPSTGAVDPTPYLEELDSDSNNRAYVSFLDNTQFTRDWSGHLVGNYVTDPYYFKDFGAVYGDATNNQLLNQADIDYDGNYWTFLGMVQGFQTLHLIDNAGSDVQSQYIRAPEFDLNGDYPELWGGLVAQLGVQSVNFIYNSTYAPFTDQMPIGERVHLMPSLSRPFAWSWGYIKPFTALDSTNYDAQNAVVAPDTERTSIQASRNLPLFNVDSGLYFQRDWHLGADGYVQTLEPRLFYLYVPYINQDQYPVFDTQILSFSYDELFSLNRFSGFDRLENANQFSMGITSRFLDSATSLEKFRADLGTIYYLTSPKVCLNPADCEDSTYNIIPRDSQWSPVVSRLTYSILPAWSVSGEYAWNPETQQTDHGNVFLSYMRDPLHIFRLGYQFIESSGNSVDSYGLSNDTNDIFSGIGWPITEKISALGYGFYNFSKERFDQYYGGLQYNTCCWAMRTVASRSWTGNQPDVNGDVSNQYDTIYTIQFELKSLGSFGTGTSDSLINSTVPGFLNPFAR